MTRNAIPALMRHGRLPQPTWGRDGETWRVIAEMGWSVLPPGGMRCGADSSDGYRLTCPHRAVAMFVRRDEATPYCDRHLRASGYWVEDGHVVCWLLRR